MGWDYTNDEAVIKTMQDLVSIIGRNLEKVIKILIQNFCNENNLRVTNDKT